MVQFTFFDKNGGFVFKTLWFHDAYSESELYYYLDNSIATVYTDTDGNVHMYIKIKQLAMKDYNHVTITIISFKRNCRHITQ